MRATVRRHLVLPLAVLGLAACGSDDSSSATTTTDRPNAIVVEGIDGSDTWSLGLKPRGKGFCLTLEIDPPIASVVVVGRAAPLRSLVHIESAGANSCLGQQLEADSRSISFEPVFAPFIYQGRSYRRPVIAGAVSEGARDLKLELGSGGTTPVSVRAGGLFVEFPSEDVVAVRITLDGDPWRCEMGSIVGVGPCTQVE